jgi:hypothetical protein
MDGFCECDRHWNGPDCTYYIGVCHTSCRQCFGPGPTDCSSCNGHATIQLDNSCLCDTNYFGADCKSYFGPCDTHCDECFGPTAEDCVRCVDNAFRDAASGGACVCYNGWSGDGCETETDLCTDEHCVLCDYERDDDL